LDLSYNILEHIEPGTFEPLINAEIIRLNNNFIVDLEGALINEIEPLKEVTISFNIFYLFKIV
jgi:hypothetical protein